MTKKVVVSLGAGFADSYLDSSKQEFNSNYVTISLKFIKRVLVGNPPIIFRDVEQIKDFTFIMDIIPSSHNSG